MPPPPPENSKSLRAWADHDEIKAEHSDKEQWEIHLIFYETPPKVSR